ncbi:hypothetical protein HNP12_003394 [Aeromonas hydrophila]|uniref:hypothetical protein n=1 Tax=Aeromonas hydrophila TaxID=644 RepID=UPI0021670B96|nr:hypothetical protein [Aeromonas hydrophila]MCS3769281.1 hypothetical protein [Aeromonas hydrophila]MCS3791522.1 hypothetical protein [Aeromonas hydrophila]
MSKRALIPATAQAKVENELEAEIAALLAIATVKLATLRRYQRQLLILRRTRLPAPKFALCRLLFECREERRASAEAIVTAAIQARYLALLQSEPQLPL